MGFLDAQIPDWLKPPSPADQAHARSQAIITGLQIGAQAAQHQLQREQSERLQLMKLAQDAKEFDLHQDLREREFKSQAAVRNLAIDKAKNNEMDALALSEWDRSERPKLKTAAEILAARPPVFLNPENHAKFMAGLISLERQQRLIENHMDNASIFNDLRKTALASSSKYPVLASMALNRLNLDPELKDPKTVEDVNKFFAQIERQRLAEFNTLHTRSAQSSDPVVNQIMGSYARDLLDERQVNEKLKALGLPKKFDIPDPVKTVPGPGRMDRLWNWMKPTATPPPVGTEFFGAPPQPTPSQDIFDDIDEAESAPVETPAIPPVDPPKPLEFNYDKATRSLKPFQ